MCSQAAHASMKVILDMMEDYQIGPGRNIKKQLVVVDGSVLDDWINGLFTKITCGCDSLEELENLYKKAQSLKLPCSIITDMGLTEFKGIPTITAVAIGPDVSEKIDLITGNLNLL